MEPDQESEIWKNKGNEFYKQQNFEEAVKCYGKAIELNPESEKVWYNLGKALKQLGKDEESEHCFNQYREIASLNKIRNPKTKKTKIPMIKLMAIIVPVVVILLIIGVVAIPLANHKNHNDNSQLQQSTPPTIIITSIQTTIPSIKPTSTLITPSTPAKINQKYASGAFVQKATNDSSYDQNIAWVIVKVNNDGTYSVGKVYYDLDSRIWFKVTDELLEVREYHAVERDYPAYLNSVIWENIPAKHYAEDPVDKTVKLQWNNGRDYSSDPIVGEWKVDLTSSDDTEQKIATYTFSEDGKYTAFLSNSDWDAPLTGTYTKTSQNGYRVIIDVIGNIYTYNYDSTTDTLIDTEYPYVIIYRSDKVPYKPLPSYSSSSSDTITLSGYGDDVVSFTATGTGLRIFTMKYTGQHNFAVELKDGQGEYISLLANEIGSYSGKKSELLSTGKYYLDVTASGPWSIKISS